MEKLSKEQLADLRTSGKILARALNEVISFVKPGITTESLDEIAERSLRRQGAIPSFKNYKVSGCGRFPKSLCVSVNDELVHGIPDSLRVLKNGDIVSLDLGANFRGLFTDMAATVAVGKIKPADQKLIDITREVLAKAINYIKPGMTTGDLGNFIENCVSAAGLVVIHDLVGHGIGLAPHLPPQVPNFGRKGKGVIINEGMILAIEPMVAGKSSKVKTTKDGWTIKMAGGQRCAHFEQTVLIAKNGCKIITRQ